MAAVVASKVISAIPKVIPIIKGIIDLLPRRHKEKAEALIAKGPGEIASRVRKAMDEV